jgi:hypothetical protein
LSLLANTVMAWNTMQMQAVVNRWVNGHQVIEAAIMTGASAPPAVGVI